jgi:hypothetical protein
VNDGDARVPAGEPANSEVAPVPSSPAVRRRPVRTALAGLAVVGAVGFALVSLTAADGAGSPEEAVEAFFAAIDAEDAIGVVESLEPSEREILLASLDETRAEAERMEVADGSLDLREVVGLEIEVRDLAMAPTVLADDVVALDLSAGTVSTAADLDRLPLGAVVREVIDRAEDGEEWEHIERHPAGEIDLAGVRVVAVQRGGTWHVSLLHSIAEAIRADLDGPPAYPDAADAIAAVGAASPEAAVREGIEAALALDVRKLIELTPADEAAVLHTYGPILVAEAEASLGGERPRNAASDIDLEVSDGPDGRKHVTANSLTLTFVGGSGTQTIEYVGGCTTHLFTLSEGRRADLEAELGPDWEQERPWLGHPAEEATWCEAELDWRDAFLPFGFLSSPASSTIVVEQHDGRWFLSPVRSLFETAIGRYLGWDADHARRVGRAMAGEWAFIEHSQLWEACGVDPPDLDESRAAASDRLERCYEQLPEDYRGPWGFPWLGAGLGGIGSTEFKAVGEADWDVVGGPAETDPYAADRCFWPYEDAGPVDRVAVEACLTELVEEGTIGRDELVDFQCSAPYDLLDAIPSRGPDGDTEAWDEAFEAAARAVGECLQRGGF